MREIKVKQVELSNGETINYREAAGGHQTLVLIHGNMNSSVNWDLLMEHLSGDLSIYALDLRGYGKSTYNQPIESIKELSDDVKLFVEALDLKDFTLSGWSLGGAVAMQYAVDHQDDLKNLILLSSSSIKGFPVRKRTIFGKPKKTFIQTKEEMAKMIRPLERFKEKNSRWILKNLLNRSLYSVNQPEEVRYNTYIDEMIAQQNLADVNYALMTFNLSNEHNGVVEGTNQANQINVPTLIIQGDQDKVVSVAMAKENQEHIGANAHLQVFEGSGHSILLDDLERLIESYESFILENKEK